MMTYIDMFLLSMKMKLMGFIKDEKGETSIVAMVVLIGVAVLLAILFKDEIAKLVKSLLKTITNNATDVVNKKV